MKKEESKLRKLKRNYLNKKKQEEAGKINKQIVLDPGGVYSNFKRIIDNQEGVDKPRYDHKQQDAERSENMFSDVTEATAFWSMNVMADGRDWKCGIGVALRSQGRIRGETIRAPGGSFRALCQTSRENDFEETQFRLERARP